MREARQSAFKNAELPCRARSEILRPAVRQYISKENIGKDGLLFVSGKDFRYLRSVLRVKPGDMIHVRLPDNALQAMTVCAVDEKAKKISMQICGITSAEQDGENLPKETNAIESCELTLFMAVPKSSKFELIVRQATECGVARIVPVKTEFSQAGAEKMNFKSERFGRIIKEARQQSGSPVNTKITEHRTLTEAAELWQSETRHLAESEKLAVVLYERNDSTVSIFEASEKMRNQQNQPAPENSAHPKKIALFCGSEGGISPDEIKILQGAGFTAVHLKTNILRCETAALYGIAAIQSSIN